MHNLAMGHASDKLSYRDLNLSVTQITKTEEGYMVHLQSSDTVTRLSRTARAIALDDALVSSLSAQDALQIGFWLGIEAAS